MALFSDPNAAGQSVFLPKSRNFLRQLIWHDCARPWYVYAETFLPAFLELAILVNFPFPDDVFRTYAETLGQTQGSGRRGKRHGARRARVTVSETRAQRITRQGLNTVLKVTQPLESLGFAWLLLSAGDNFFGRWQTLLEHSTFCTGPLESGPCSRSGVPAFITPREFGQGFTLDVEEQCRGPWQSTPFGITTAKGMIHVNASLTGKARIAGITDAQLVLQVLRNGVQINEFASDKVTVAGEGDVDLVVSGDYYASTLLDPTTVVWLLRGQTQIAALEPTDGHCFAMRL